MSLKTKITGESGKVARVTNEGVLNVIQHPHPPINEGLVAIPFRQYFTDDGHSTGSNNMAVNGLFINQEFYISANGDFDIYINSISVEIGDGGSPALNKFGDLTALTNGVAFYWFTKREGEYELHEGIKTNKEFIRIATATGAIGTGTEAYLADVSGGGTEKSYFPLIDFSDSYGLQYGVRLRKGTTDKLAFRVRDNLTGLTTFNAQAFGIRI